MTLSDGTTDTVYRLAGASRFGGNFNEVNGKYVFTDTEFFNIIGPSGVWSRGSPCRAHVVRGRNLSFTFGRCEPAQD